MYLYENHLDGGLYAAEEELSYEELHCETCGDTDWIVGVACSRREAWQLVRDDVDIGGSGGWDPEYILEFLVKNWPDEEWIPEEYSKYEVEK